MDSDDRSVYHRIADARRRAWQIEDLLSEAVLYTASAGSAQCRELLAQASEIATSLACECAAIHSEVVARAPCACGCCGDSGRIGSDIPCRCGDSDRRDECAPCGGGTADRKGSPFADDDNG